MISSVLNLLPSSQQVGGPSWYPNGDSVTSTSIAAPDGSNSGGAVTAPSTSPGGTISVAVESPAPYSSKTVTASVYLRVPSGTMNIGLYIGNTGSSGFSIIGSSNVVVNTSWQRFPVLGTTAAGTTLLYLQIGGGSPGSIPAGQTLDIWGTQMVLGSSPDGYVETQNTTTVTGASQTLAANGLNQAYS